MTPRLLRSRAVSALLLAAALAAVLAAIVGIIDLGPRSGLPRAGPWK